MQSYIILVINHNFMANINVLLSKHIEIAFVNTLAMLNALLCLYFQPSVCKQTPFQFLICINSITYLLHVLTYAQIVHAFHALV